MKERYILAAFGKALVETPLSIILLVLDIVGIGAVIYWVVDDLSEAVVIIAFLIILLVSQYLVFRKLWTTSQSFPQIFFDQARQAQMHQPSQILKRSMPTYQLIQAWFRNLPSSPSDSSVAREVTAKVILNHPDGTPSLEYYGQWAKSNAPDNVGFEGFIDKVDIAPGHLRAKLMIALKYPSESQGYAFTREGLRSNPDGRSPRYAIPEGDYEVKVHLSGIGVDEIFKFHLSNKGAQHNLELLEQMKVG